MKDIIIEVKYGGLGDHLFYSHIPKLAKERGHKVFVSTRSVFRNPEYMDLIWKRNKYVTGVTDLPGTGCLESLGDIREDENLLGAISRSVGIEGEIEKHPNPYLDYTIEDADSYFFNRYCNRYCDHMGHFDPIFMRIMNQHQVTGFGLVDLNFISYVGNIDPDRLVDKLINDVFSDTNKVLGEKLGSSIPIYVTRGKEDSDFCNAVTNRFYGSLASQYGNITMLPRLNFMEYVALVFMARDFFCLTSGGATLRSCFLGDHVYGPRYGLPRWKPTTTCYYGNGQNPAFHHVHPKYQSDHSFSYIGVS